MEKLTAVIDGVSEWVGKVLGWCTLLMVLTTVTVVVLRYLVQSGNIIFLQELIVYLHAATFMLGAAWALQHQRHVRVDVFFRQFSPRTKAWIDSLGTLVFLLPFSVFLLLASRDFVLRSWSILETSAEPGGIPALFVLKSFISAMAILLILQAVAELLRNIAVLITTEQES